MELCCTECFNDEYLINHIKKNGSQNNCCFCGANNVTCLPAIELKDIFFPLIKLYTPIIDFMPTHFLKNYDGDMIWDKLNEDWEIFENSIDKREELIREIFSDLSNEEDLFLNEFVEIESFYWDSEGKFSDSLKKKWENFSNQIKYENRYIFSDEFLLEDFFDEMVSISDFLELNVSKGTKFYRARKNKGFNNYSLNDFGPPPIGKSTLGRANPVGIPYLYIASNIYTALAEVNPFLNDEISVCELKTKKDLSICDLSKNFIIDSPFKYSENLHQLIDLIGFLRYLANEISKPVSPEKSHIDYLPLQYLCEYFKYLGFHGIAYKSSKAEGINYAIFNTDRFDFIEVKKYLISDLKKIEFTYEKINSSEGID